MNTATNDYRTARVSVTDFDITFSSLVLVLFKFFWASIVAGLLVALTIGIGVGVLMIAAAIVGAPMGIPTNF